MNRTGTFSSFFFFEDRRVFGFIVTDRNSETLKANHSTPASKPNSTGIDFRQKGGTRANPVGPCFSRLLEPTANSEAREARGEKLKH